MKSLNLRKIRLHRFEYALAQRTVQPSGGLVNGAGPIAGLDLSTAVETLYTSGFPWKGLPKTAFHQGCPMNRLEYDVYMRAKKGLKYFVHLG